MKEIFCSFMNMSQCNAPVCVMNVFVFVFALEAIHIVSTFIYSKIFIFFELEAILLCYRLLEPRMNRLSNVDQMLG